jgi:DNA-binding NtrC family response regulator/tetratricopeptide (TPR) repeat protein
LRNELAEKKRRLKRTADPTEQVKLMLELAQGLYYSDKGQARQYAAQALKLARKQGDEKSVAQAANLAADLLRVAGRITQALKHCELALEVARRIQDREAETDSLNNLGLICWHRGEFDPAIAHFEQALNLSENTGNRRSLSRAMANLSLLHWEKGNLGPAMDYQERCLVIREQLNDRHGIGTSHLNLGLIYCDMGDWDKATECYYRALVELEKHGDKTDIALCYNNLGEVYLRRNKPEKARPLLEEAVKTAEQTHSPWTKAEALGNLGELHFRQGDLLRARDCLEQDIRLSARMDDKEELSESYRRMAELLLAGDDLTEARRMLDQALKQVRRTGARKESGNVWRVAGNLQARLGNSESARQAFEKAQEILRELGANYELARVYLDHGKALSNLGQPESGSYLRRAEDLFKHLGAQYELDATTEALSALQKKGTPLGGMSPSSDLLATITDLAARSSSLEELGTRVAGLLKESYGVETGKMGTLPVFAPKTGSVPTFPRRSDQAHPLLIGADTSLKPILDTIQQVAPTRACVLIRGESGTGKELVARLIHRRSDRAGQPFVAINCAAIPETLLESELFGIERGTATGVSERRGKFEHAQGGTVFLDEVGDMTLTLQAKLLRVVQEKQFDRVGGRKPISVDVRIIAATNKDLERAIAEGQFREDLFYRLNVVCLDIPPLRNRKGDIPRLINHFLDKYALEYGRPAKTVAAEAMARLMSFHWPGNVRELENAIERASIVSRGDQITMSDLPTVLQQPGRPESGSTRTEDFRQARTQARSDAEQVAKEFLLQVLDKHDWNMSQSAQAMDVTRRHLYRLLRKHQIKRPQPGSKGSSS